MPSNISVRSGPNAALSMFGASRLEPKAFGSWVPALKTGARSSTIASEDGIRGDAVVDFRSLGSQQGSVHCCFDSAATSSVAAPDGPATCTMSPATSESGGLLITRSDAASQTLQRRWS